MSDVNLEREQECNICMETSEKIVLPGCGHSMCIQCFRDWVLAMVLEHEYERYFRLADRDGDGKVGLDEGLLFLKASGLAHSLLVQLWELADKGKTDALNQSEFTDLLKMVGLSQLRVPLKYLVKREFDDLSYPMVPSIRGVGGGTVFPSPEHRKQMQFTRRRAVPMKEMPQPKKLSPDEVLSCISTIKGRLASESCISKEKDMLELALKMFTGSDPSIGYNPQMGHFMMSSAERARACGSEDYTSPQEMDEMLPYLERLDFLLDLAIPPPEKIEEIEKLIEEERTREQNGEKRRFKESFLMRQMNKLKKGTRI